ncbi:MAG: hypothetical protein ACXWYD_01415 [Candidatus Binatia bacterium]
MESFSGVKKLPEAMIFQKQDKLDAPRSMAANCAVTAIWWKRAQRLQQ